MAGSGGRGSLRARRRLGTASPPPAPLPTRLGVWGCTGGRCPRPCPSSPPLLQQRGESRASSPGGALRGEGMNPPPSRGTDPELSSLGSLGVTALGPPCTPLPTDTCQDSPAPGEPSGHCGFQRSWEGQWHNPPFPPQPREREPLTGTLLRLPPPPRLHQRLSSRLSETLSQTNVTSVYRTAAVLKCHQTPASTPRHPKGQVLPSGEGWPRSITAQWSFRRFSKSFLTTHANPKYDIIAFFLFFSFSFFFLFTPRGNKYK